MSFIDGESRDQINLLPPCVDDYVAADALVRVVDAFVDSLDLAELGFGRVVAAATGRPGYEPGDMLRLFAGMNQAMDAVCADFDDAQLATIQTFLARAAQAGRESAELLVP